MFVFIIARMITMDLLLLIFFVEDVLFLSSNVDLISKKKEIAEFKILYGGSKWSMSLALNNPRRFICH